MPEARRRRGVARFQQKRRDPQKGMPAVFSVERVTGIEPVSQPWEGRVLPLNHTRASDDAHTHAAGEHNKNILQYREWQRRQRRRPSRASCANKIFLFMALIGIVPLVAAAALTYYVVTSSHRDDVAKLEAAVMTQTAGEVQSFINERHPDADERGVPVWRKYFCDVVRPGSAVRARPDARRAAVFAIGGVCESGGEWRPPPRIATIFSGSRRRRLRISARRLRSRRPRRGMIISVRCRTHRCRDGRCGESARADGYVRVAGQGQQWQYHRRHHGRRRARRITEHHRVIHRGRYRLFIFSGSGRRADRAAAGMPRRRYRQLHPSRECRWCKK